MKSSTSSASESAWLTSTQSFSGWSVTNGSILGLTFTFTENKEATAVAQWAPDEIDLPTTTRTGYTFRGWYEDEQFTKRAGDGYQTYTPTKNIKLYAKWEANQYTIEYYSRGIKLGSTKFTYDKENEKLATIDSLKQNGEQQR